MQIMLVELRATAPPLLWCQQGFDAELRVRNAPIELCLPGHTTSAKAVEEVVQQQIRAYMNALSLREPWPTKRLSVHQTLSDGSGCWIHLVSVEVPALDAGNLSVLTRRKFQQLSLYEFAARHIAQLTMYAIALPAILTQLSTNMTNHGWMTPAVRVLATGAKHPAMSVACGADPRTWPSTQGACGPSQDVDMD